MITVPELREKRKTTRCEWCKVREGTQRHHCLIHDTKRFHAVLSVEENLMLGCAYCHIETGVLNSDEVRAWFWDVQCKRYGVEHMLEWLDSLPDKLKRSRRVDFARITLQGQ